MHFGQSSEKMKKPESLEPMPLFPEYDEATVEAMDNTLPPIATSEIVDAIEEETKQRKAKKKTEQKSKQQRERRTLRLPDNLEREVVTLYPDGYDSEKMEIIGKDSTITLERRTQEYYLKEVVRVICINKSEKGSTRPRVMQHPLLPRISEHGYLGDSMIVNILVDKFCHHLPEYRQAKIFREHGLDIPTSTINRAVHQAIDKLYPILLCPNESGAAFPLCTYGRNGCKRKRPQGQDPQGVSMGYGRRQSAQQRAVLLLQRRFAFATSDATYAGRV